MTWREHARTQLGQLPRLIPAAVAAGEDLSSCPTSPRLLLPNNRLKFLCSYGGKIVPRPSDGHLKYVGGHTRVLAVPRSISFSELKERVDGMVNGRVAAIKYELAAEGIDTLVSITCDDDLTHMLDEYDRLEASHPSSPSAAAASPRFRLFLFTSPSSASSSTGTSPSSTIDAPASFRLSALLASTPDLAGGGSGQHSHSAPENIFLRRQRSSGSTAYYCGGGGSGCCCRPSWAPQPAAEGGPRSCAGCSGHADRSCSAGRPSRRGSPLRSRRGKPIVWWE